MSLSLNKRRAVFLAAALEAIEFHLLETNRHDVPHAQILGLTALAKQAAQELKEDVL